MDNTEMEQVLETLVSCIYLLLIFLRWFIQCKLYITFLTGFNNWLTFLEDAGYCERQHTTETSSPLFHHLHCKYNPNHELLLHLDLSFVCISSPCFGLAFQQWERLEWRRKVNVRREWLVHWIKIFRLLVLGTLHSEVSLGMLGSHIRVLGSSHGYSIAV